LAIFFRRSTTNVGVIGEIWNPGEIGETMLVGRGEARRSRRTGRGACVVVEADSVGSAGARDDVRGGGRTSEKMRPLRFDAVDSILSMLDTLETERLRE
jgi:hypothetical protein